MADGTIFSDLHFKVNVAGLVGGESRGGILRLRSALETGFGLRGIEPHAVAWGELVNRGRFRNGMVHWIDGTGFEAENNFAFFVNH